MKGRKLIAVVLVLVMIAAVSLSACNNDKGSSGGGTTSGGTTSSDPGNTSGDPTDLGKQIAQAAIDYGKLVASEVKDSATSSKDTFTFAAVLEPGLIRLDRMLDFTQMPFCTAAQEYFLQWDYASETFISRLCDSYEVDADNKGVTFNLKPGIKMHDGNTFGPQDVMTSIQAFRDHNVMGWQLDFVDLEASEAVNDTTLHLQFKDVNGTWESGFVMFTVISGEAYNAVGGDESFYEAPIGPMPYQVTEWAPGDHITLTRFDDYYLGTPPIKTITMKIISDRTAAFMALQNGEIDLLWSISADQVKTVYASDAMENLMTGANMMIYMGMNSGNEALSDLRVREAIYLAVNRDDIILGAYDGLATVANSMVSPESIGYNKSYDTNSPFPAQDIEKAKSLLADAGYGNGLTLRLLAESTINFQLVTEQLVAQLDAIGITLEPMLTDSATLTSIVFSSDTSGYDLYLHVAQAAGDSINMVDNPMLFGASHPELSADGSGTEYAALWGKVRSTPKLADRAKAYEDVQAYFFEKGKYWLPLAVSQTYVGVNTDLTGMVRGGIMIYFDHAYFR